MSTTSSFWSPTAWLNSAHVEHWLRGIWPSWRMNDVRHDWDEAGRWFWVVPDFDQGRSRIIGIPRSLLERTTVTKLRQTLEDADWMVRIEREALLVDRIESGVWVVNAWEPVVEEKWFRDTTGEFFVAFRDSAPLVSAGAPPARIPRPFLALHGKTWSAMGPEEPRPVGVYSLEELVPFLPKDSSPAS